MRSGYRHQSIAGPNTLTIARYYLSYALGRSAEAGKAITSISARSKHPTLSRRQTGYWRISGQTWTSGGRHEHRDSLCCFARRCDAPGAGSLRRQGARRSHHICLGRVALANIDRQTLVVAQGDDGPGRYVYPVARRLDRDVKAVHADVHALLDAGVLERTEGGRIIFPYDAVHVDFMLHKVA